jgi:hypothetical protein
LKKGKVMINGVMFDADIPDSVQKEFNKSREVLRKKISNREKPSSHFVCPVCDVDFVSWGKRVCCSQACRKKFLQVRIFYCNGCGAKVVNKKKYPNQHFCSKECRYVYRTQRT